MPPKKTYDDSTQLLKEKLQGANVRRNGKAAATNGSGLKEVDNASTNSGHTNTDLNSSNVSLTTFCARGFKLQPPHVWGI
jgi:histone deacetylase complex subunit SAP30